MQPTKLTDRNVRHTGLVWADAKVGKSTWLMSLPGNKLIVNFDPDGFMSFAHREDVSVLDLAPLPPREAISQAEKAASYIVENKDAFTSVVLDSATTLTSVALQDAVARKVGASALFTPTIDAPGLQGYGARNNNVNSVMDRLFRATAQANMHFFITAHSDDPEYDKKGENILQQTVMLSAKIRNQAGLKVSEIWHMELASQGRRFVYLAPYGVKKPMGSRIFDTTRVPKFQLSYDIDKDDAEQPHALANIFAAWDQNGRRKLTSAP